MSMEILSRRSNSFTFCPYIYMWALLFFIFLLFLGCSTCNKWLGIPDDHPVEEISEMIIEYKTGISVDLTPESPE